jgi:hypothetical protein
MKNMQEHLNPDKEFHAPFGLGFSEALKEDLKNQKASFISI